MTIRNPRHPAVAGALVALVLDGRESHHLSDTLRAPIISLIAEHCALILDESQEPVAFGPETWDDELLGLLALIRDHSTPARQTAADRLLDTLARQGIYYASDTDLPRRPAPAALAA